MFFLGHFFLLIFFFLGTYLFYFLSATLLVRMLFFDWDKFLQGRGVMLLGFSSFNKVIEMGICRNI